MSNSPVFGIIDGYAGGGKGEFSPSALEAMSDKKLLSVEKQVAPARRMLCFAALCALFGAGFSFSEIPALSSQEDELLRSPPLSAEYPYLPGRIEAKNDNSPLRGRLSIGAASPSKSSRLTHGDVVRLEAPAGGSASVDVFAESSAEPIVRHGKFAPTAPANFGPAAAQWANPNPSLLNVQQKGPSAWTLTLRAPAGQAASAWAYVGRVAPAADGLPALRVVARAATSSQIETVGHKDITKRILGVSAAFCLLAAIAMGGMGEALCAPRRLIKARTQRPGSLFFSLKEKDALSKAMASGKDASETPTEKSRRAHRL